MELLVAVSLLALGLVAVAGLVPGVARQTRQAAVRTGQTLAAEQVLGAMLERGYPAAVPGAGDTTVEVGGRSYTVTRTVRQVGTDLREIEVAVAGADGVASRVFATRVHRERALP